MSNYGFLGCGNMGGAIARAMSTKSKNICLSDRSGRGKALAEELGVRYAPAEEMAACCDRIFLAVKPHMMAEALAPLKEILEQRQPLLISMAAGLELKTIQELAGVPLPIVRIMPNTPTAVGKGVIPYCANALADEQTVRELLADMAPCGLLDPLEERLMDAASALSGSGPAYMYLLLDALADGGVACGLPRSKALEYAAMTMAGSAQMYLDTHHHPGAMKDAVCSPGGSTIDAVAVLERGGFRSAAIDCVLAAYQKNKQLGKS